MIKKQVDVKLAVADFETVLASDKSKTASEFEKKFLNVYKQTRFQLALMKRFFQGEKVEEIRVFQESGRQRGMWRRQRFVEIADRRAGALVEAVFDLQGERVAAPALRYRLVGVPVTNGDVLDFSKRTT